MASCSQPKKNYTLILIRESTSLRNEKELKTDHKDFFAVSNEAAFDTLAGTLYGHQYADSLLRDMYKKHNRMEDYKYVQQKPVSIQVLDDAGNDIILTLSDSAIASSYLKYKTKPLP